MKKLTLNNKQLADTIFAFLEVDKRAPKIEEKDKAFVIEYEIKADEQGGDCIEQKLMSLANYLLNRQSEMFDYTMRQVDLLWTAVYAHSEGHLPKLTPSALTKLIKTAGMDDDYVVVPRQIWANNTAIEFNTEELRAAINKVNATERVATEGDEDVKRLITALKESKAK